MNCKSTGLLVILLGLIAWPSSAMAYIGPGGGISAIGVFLALVVGLILAVMGFVWYPLKRLFRKRRRPAPAETEEPA